MVLNNMKETAESYLGGTVNNAVVTVPVYFNILNSLDSIDDIRTLDSDRVHSESVLLRKIDSNASVVFVAIPSHFKLHTKCECTTLSKIRQTRAHRRQSVFNVERPGRQGRWYHLWP